MTPVKWTLLPAAANQWKHRLTPAGQYVTVGLLIAVVFGARSLSIPIYHLVGLGGVLCLTTIFVGWLFRPRLDVSARFPEKAVAGQPVRVELTVRNRSRLPVFDLNAGFLETVRYLNVEPGPAVDQLRRGASARLSLEMLPRKRGFFTLPRLATYSTFPFHLGKSPGTRAAPPPLLVLPHFHALAGVDVPLGRRYQPGGVALTSNVGESTEYIGNRDYVPGDRMSHIDFRSWARLARPVVREFQQEYYCRIALVLDTFIAPGRREGRDGFPDLESAVSLAAAIADSLTRGEHLIDIFAAGPELYVFRAGRHLAHLENILEILACVDACRRDPFDAVAPALAEELANVTSVVYVMLDWDDTRARFVQTAVEAGCATRAIVVRSQPPMRSPEADAWAGPIAVFTPDDVQKGEIEFL